MSEMRLAISAFSYKRTPTPIPTRLLSDDTTFKAPIHGLICRQRRTGKGAAAHIHEPIGANLQRSSGAVCPRRDLWRRSRSRARTVRGTARTTCGAHWRSPRAWLRVQRPQGNTRRAGGVRGLALVMERTPAPSRDSCRPGGPEQPAGSKPSLVLRSWTAHSMNCSKQHQRSASCVRRSSGRTSR
jgi:hypothetical protein